MRSLAQVRTTLKALREQVEHLRPPPWWVDTLKAVFSTLVVVIVAVWVLRQEISHSEALFRRTVEQEHAAAASRDSLAAVVFARQVSINATILHRNLRQLARELGAWPNTSTFQPLQTVFETSGSGQVLPFAVVLDTALSRLATDLALAERALNAGIARRNDFKLRVSSGPSEVVHGRRFGDPGPKEHLQRELDSGLLPEHRALIALADSFVAVFDRTHGQHAP